MSNEDDEAVQEVEVIALRRLSEEEIEDEAYGQRKSQMDPIASAQTDDRGQYRIFGLKPGEYYIRAEDSFQPSGQVMRADDWLRDWAWSRILLRVLPWCYPGFSSTGCAD